MRERITNKLLRALSVQDKPYEVYDTEVSGFVLRVWPGGRMTYCAQYRRPDGKRTRLTLGSADILTPAQARDDARRALASVARGEDPAEAKRRARVHTLKTYLDEVYTPWATTHLRTGGEAVKRIETCFPDFMNERLDGIAPLAVERWRSARLKQGRRPATLNKDVATLKAALSKAVEWGLLARHPLSSVKPQREDRRARIRYLSPEEERRLRESLDARETRLKAGRSSANAWRRERGYEEWDEVPADGFADYLKPMVLLSLNTGLRRGEVFNLRWRDVNLEKAMLTVEGETAKTHTTRHVPLNQEALETLRSCARQSDRNGHVFKGRNGGPFDNVNNSWRKLLRDAEIEGFRWHDMRHHFASRLVMAGVDLNTVRELLGHSDIKMTLRYAHLAPQVKADAVSRISGAQATEEDASGGAVAS